MAVSPNCCNHCKRSVQFASNVQVFFGRLATKVIRGLTRWCSGARESPSRTLPTHCLAEGSALGTNAFKPKWNVRPQCAKLDINSLHRWAEWGNVFNETGSHGVRQLVTAPELLSPID